LCVETVDDVTSQGYIVAETILPTYKDFETIINSNILGARKTVRGLNATLRLTCEWEQRMIDELLNQI
jgi:hypothetical protein